MNNPAPTSHQCSLLIHTSRHPVTCHSHPPCTPTCLMQRVSIEWCWGDRQVDIDKYIDRDRDMDEEIDWDKEKLTDTETHILAENTHT